MTLRELLNRLRDRAQRDRLTRELQDELQFHQAMIERDQRSLGLPEEEARRRSVLQLGRATLVTETTRDAWSLGWLDDLLHDLRYAVRVLRHNLTFALTAVMTIALGIGANAAIFSAVNAVLLRPLPYADPDRLYAVSSAPANAPLDRNPASYPDLRDWRHANTVFTDIGGYVFNRFELSGKDRADVVRGVVGTPNLYHVLGATPLIGRMPRVDEGQMPVAAISHGLWQQRFYGDRAIAGKTMVLDEHAYTIVGVMPPGFEFPTPDVELWLSSYPLTTARVGTPNEANPWFASRGFRAWRTVARLRDGVSATAAETQMNQIMSRIAAAHPEEAGGISIRLASIREDSVRSVQRTLWLILGAAGLVLLLACVNVAHLILARTSARTRELAIRRAIGAHRGRIVRQLLTESILLGAVGGAVGIGVAAAAIPVLIAVAPRDIPRLETMTLDPLTLGFAAAISIFAGLLFGLVPTLVAWRGGVQTTLREQARGMVGVAGGRTRSVLTVAEVAFAMMLLVGAGLMVRSFVRLLAADTGFRSDNVAVFHVALSGARYSSSELRVAGLERVLAAIRAIPGVGAAGGSTSMPPARMQQGGGFAIEGDPPPPQGQQPFATFVSVTPGFHEALHVPLLEGRSVGTVDGIGAPRVVVVNRELVRRHLGGRPVLGQQLLIGNSLWTIVGVVGDVPYEGVGKPAHPTIYRPFAQSPFSSAWVALRSVGDLRSVLPAIPDALHSADRLMNARELRTLEELVTETIVRPRFQTFLLSTFAVLALLLAAIGIYGVIAYGVAQRTTEIGLRLALGAPVTSVVLLLLRRAMLPVVVGLAVGIAAALAWSRVMAALLFQLSPTDLATFVGVTLLLGGVALIAAYVPASRAARLDPLTALRAE